MLRLLLIENKLKESPYIENIMVIGAEEKYAGALIIPSFNDLKAMGEANRILNIQPMKK